MSRTESYCSLQFELRRCDPGVAPSLTFLPGALQFLFRSVIARSFAIPPLCNSVLQLLHSAIPFCSSKPSLPIPCNEEGAENDAKHETMEQPCDCQDKNVFVYHDPIQNNNAPEMVPVVIVAALPASASIQNSLESAMQLVKESLSTAVARIRKSLTKDFSSKKRPNGDTDDISADNLNTGYLQAILASAVCEGLKSFHSYSTLQEASILREKSNYNIKPVLNTASSTCDRSNGLDLPPMSVSMENVHGVSVVFAAAVIPQSSSTHAISEDQTHLSIDDRENSHYIAVEKTSGDQEIEQRKDPENINSVQNKKLSEQESTPHYNVVFEDDSSSDSGRQRVYMSDDDSYSSEAKY